MEKSSSETSNGATLQQLIAENAALLDAKVTAEKTAATVSSQVHFLTDVVY